MRVILAAPDTDDAEWLAHVLGGAGYSVVVLPDVGPSSPELKDADLVITDITGARALGDAGPTRRLLIAPRGATVDLAAIEGRFTDVLAMPSAPEDVLAHVERAARK
jgi:hypothetical protein